MKEQAVNPEELDTHSESPADTVNEAPANAHARQHYMTRKRMLLVVLASLLVVLLAGVVWLIARNRKDAAYQPNVTSAQQETSVVVEGTPDEWYIADTTEKSLKFYNTKGALIRELSFGLAGDYLVGSVGLDQNESVQVIKGGKRVFVYAGQIDQSQMVNMGEPVYKTHELFEIVNNKPQQVYSTPDGEIINKWVVSADGETILVKTSPATSAPVNHSYSIVKVSDKTAKKITGVIQDDASTASPLFMTPDKTTGGYFMGDGGTFTRVTYNLTSGERTVKQYAGLQCSTQTTIFCSPEWPEALSPDTKRVVYGYQASNRFGLSIIDTETGKILTDYKLDTGIESIGNVFWAPDSTRVAIDIDPFSNEGQQTAGRLNRILELEVGKSIPSQPVFQVSSPALGERAEQAADYNSAVVKIHGYSHSADYLLIYNDGRYKALRKRDKAVTGSVSTQQPDSQQYANWVR